MEYLPIRVSTLRFSSPLTFDLFVKLKLKMLLYVRNGELIEQTQMSKLKLHGEDRIFISKEQQENYLKYISESLSEATSIPSVLPVEEEMAIVEGTASTAVEVMRENPESATAFQMTSEAAIGLRQVVAKNPEGLKMMFGQKAKDSELIIKHCLNVSALSTSLAYEMGVKGRDLDNLGIAGLLHDIGQIGLDDKFVDLHLKPFDQLSKEEKKAYKNHPKLGVEILKDRPYINETILTLILRHEENTGGTGYPSGEKNITKLEAILSLVNLYDKNVTLLKQEPKRALEDILIDQVGNYDLKLLKKFHTVLKNKKLLS